MKPELLIQLLLGLVAGITLVLALFNFFRARYKSREIVEAQGKWQTDLAAVEQDVALLKNDLEWIKKYLLKDAMITLAKPNPGIPSALAKKVVNNEPLDSAEASEVIEKLKYIAETTEDLREKLRAEVGLHFIGDYLEAITNEIRKRH